MCWSEVACGVSAVATCCCLGSNFRTNQRPTCCRHIWELNDPDVRIVKEDWQAVNASKCPPHVSEKIAIHHYMIKSQSVHMDCVMYRRRSAAYVGSCSWSLLGAPRCHAKPCSQPFALLLCLRRSSIRRWREAAAAAGTGRRGGSRRSTCSPQKRALPHPVWGRMYDVGAMAMATAAVATTSVATPGLVRSTFRCSC